MKSFSCQLFSKKCLKILNKNFSRGYTSSNGLQKSVLPYNSHQFYPSIHQSPLIKSVPQFFDNVGLSKDLDTYKKFDTIKQQLIILNNHYVQEFPKHMDLLGNNLTPEYGWNGVSEQIIQRTNYMLNQTTSGGKLNRGAILVYGLQKLKKDTLKLDDVHNALTVAICTEALQSFFLVLDDLMDGSQTRRGNPSWYLYENVGMKAVNDGLLIESFFYWVLQNFLVCPTEDPLKISFIHSVFSNLFRDITLQTQIGQSLDLELTSDSNKLKEIYTYERYKAIVTYKTSYYTFYLPFISSIYINNIKNLHQFLTTDRDTFDKINDFILKIGFELGLKFQIDDDYIDCFGNEDVTGKKGTDIQDFKCSWLIVKALQLCNEKQYKIIQNNYGKDDTECIETIKNLYKELKIPEIYQEQEKARNEEITQMVKEIDDDEVLKAYLPKDMFLIMIKKLAGRTK